MMRYFPIAILLIAPSAAFQRLPLEQNDTIRKNFPVSGSGNLNVDNVNGSLHVTGYGGSEIQITARKRIRAESADAMQQAVREVKLDLTQEGNAVRAYVDGPFRSHDHQQGSRPYEVSFDFEIQAPYGTELLLKTVNAGEVKAEKISAHFDVANVNGGIDLREMSGAGNAHTVNGPIKVQFARNPAAACDLKTVNGAVDAYFQRGLAADVQLKTVNGGIYSDFEMAGRALPGETPERREGKFVYRPKRSRAGRIGSGGPELKFDTVNGSIRLHQGA